MRKWAAWLLTLILLVNFICVNAVQPVLAASLENYTVRIGLVSLYENQSSITLKNTSLVMGYETEGAFVQNAVLNSADGFTFTPDGSYCYGSVAVYDSYAAVMTAIAGLKTGNEYLTCGVSEKGQYHIYISADSAVTAATLAASLEQDGRVKFAAVENNASYRVKLTWAEGSMIIDVGADNQYPQFQAGTANEAGVYVLDLGERQYRGRMEIGRFGGTDGLTPVSVLDMEEYLYGVVACEMVPSWEMEALKAQAVCARSYAYALDKRSVTFGADFGYVLYDTTRSQVYKGYGTETEKTNQAVDATRGEMIYYRENVIKAYFYSTSGGHTENCEDVWDVALTYFRGVPDNTELYQEKAPWIVTKTRAEIAAAVSDTGVDVGTVTNVSAQIRSASGRIFRLKVTGTAGTAYLLKEKVRTALSLPDAKAKIVKYGDVPDKVYVQTQTGTSQKQISTSYIISGDGNTALADASLEQYVVISSDNLTNFPKNAPTDPDIYYFAGMGYGHGVGLSQSGAQSLALQGYDYEYIIHHYYNKVEIR